MKLFFILYSITRIMFIILMENTTEEIVRKNLMDKMLVMFTFDEQEEKCEKATCGNCSLYLKHESRRFSYSVRKPSHLISKNRGISILFYIKIIKPNPKGVILSLKNENYLYLIYIIDNELIFNYINNGTKIFEISTNVKNINEWNYIQANHYNQTSKIEIIINEKNAEEKYCDRLCFISNIFFEKGTIDLFPGEDLIGYIDDLYISDEITYQVGCLTPKDNLVPEKQNFYNEICKYNVIYNQKLKSNNSYMYSIASFVIRTQNECYENCCILDNCNIAYKSGKNCTLFNCKIPSLCQPVEYGNAVDDVIFYMIKQGSSILMEKQLKLLEQEINQDSLIKKCYINLELKNINMIKSHINIFGDWIEHFNVTSMNNCYVLCCQSLTCDYALWDSIKYNCITIACAGECENFEKIAKTFDFIEDEAAIFIILNKKGEDRTLGLDKNESECNYSDKFYKTIKIEDVPISLFNMNIINETICKEICCKSMTCPFIYYSKGYCYIFQCENEQICYNTVLEGITDNLNEPNEFIILKGKTKENFTRLRDPKIIAIEPEYLHLKQNETANFYCNAVGNPKPIINWYKMQNETMFEIKKLSKNKFKIYNENLIIKQIHPNDGGTYVCSATNGNKREYKQVKLMVDDINECEIYQNICDQICTNLIGSYKCNCRKGYNERNNKCIDIDECKNKPCEQICINLPGSYICNCLSGYRLNKDSKTCEDINECTEFKSACRNGKCKNLNGSFECETVLEKDVQLYEIFHNYIIYIVFILIIIIMAIILYKKQKKDN